MRRSGQGTKFRTNALPLFRSSAFPSSRRVRVSSLLAAMLRIPVAMHNVAEEKIFRPSSWSLFGALELQAADYRACQNFWPIYG